jgi:hypothetical protein
MRRSHPVRPAIAARIVLALAALVASGCGVPDQPPQQSAARPAAAPTAAPPQALGPHGQVYVHDGRARLAVMEAASGAIERELPLGTPAPDWSALYVAEPGAGRTRVRAIDPRTGQPLREIALDGAYELPTVRPDGVPGGLSPNGRWLALAAQDNGHGKSSFIVLDTAFAQPPRTAQLAGNFLFDGLDNNGSALFLIEYFAPDPSVKYQVRFYNLVQGALDPQVIVAKGEDPDAPMTGAFQLSVAAPDGTWLYGLYLNQDHGPFIHALNLTNRFAVCIDLPTDGKQDTEKQRFWSLAVDARTGSVYAANGALGLVAEVDPGQLNVRRTARLHEASADRTTHASQQAAPPAERLSAGTVALSPNGATLFALAERGLLAIDTADLTLRGRYLEDQQLDGLAISTGGARLYAASVGQIVRIDLATGTATTIPFAGQPLGVLHVEAGA